MAVGHVKIQRSCNYKESVTNERDISPRLGDGGPQHLVAVHKYLDRGLNINLYPNYFLKKYIQIYKISLFNVITGRTHAIERDY